MICFFHELGYWKCGCEARDWSVPKAQCLTLWGDRILHGTRTVLEKLIVVQIIEKFRIYYGSHRFIIMFKSNCH
jgi:hypothetical protein